MSEFMPARQVFRNYRRASTPRPSIAVLVFGFLSAALLAGCAQQTARTDDGGVWRKSNTKEYFGQKRYGKASPRVVRNGRRVPKGGGRFIVGRPYKIAGKRFYPRQYSAGFTQTGRASWYGDAFHGRKTANGEVYDMSSISAAHPTMPLPSYARVTNRKNGRSIIVRVNDRGPFHGGRVIDLSKRVADLLDFRRHGTAVVKVEYLRPASTGGSDDRKLVASLRTDGSPAQLDGFTIPGRTLFARAMPRQPPPAPRRAPEPARFTPVAARSAPPRPADFTEVALPANVPLPAERPFDLATIPGAATPIAAASPAPAARQNIARVTFFAPFTPDGRLASQLQRRGPFQGIDLTGLGRFNRRE